MTPLDLDLVPEPPASASQAVLAARHRRALVVGLGGGRGADSPLAKSSFAEPRARSASAAPAAVGSPASASSATSSARAVDAPSPGPGAQAPARRAAPAASAATPGPGLHDALVIPASTLVRGYVRCRSLLLAGDLVGNVHCTAGPVVIRSGATLKGRLVAAGDVYVCGAVGDRDVESGGGAVITTQGKVTLAPGSRVDGDVRSGRLDLYDGAMLHGVTRACED